MTPIICNNPQSAKSSDKSIIKCVNGLIDLNIGVLQAYPQGNSLTISEELEKVLTDIGFIGGVQASAIVSKDGLIMVSDCTDSVDADIIGAMIAMLIRSANHVAAELDKEDLEYLLLHSRLGEIIIMNISSNAILGVMTGKHENVGLTLFEMKKACEKIKDILGE